MEMMSVFDPEGMKGMVVSAHQCAMSATISPIDWVVATALTVAIVAVGAQAMRRLKAWLQVRREVAVSSAAS